MINFEKCKLIDNIKVVKIYGSNNYEPLETKIKRKGEYRNCTSCKQIYYIAPCYLRRIEEGAKHRVSHCSGECYKRDGENNSFFGKTHSKESIIKMSSNLNRNRFKNGENNPNKRYRENYIGTSKAWWIRYLLSNIGKCENCGFSDKRALQMHHTDKNKKNNTKENLKLLCANCHNIWHFEDKSGTFKNLKYDKQNRNQKDT